MVGVPEMTPVDELMDSPVGSPVAPKVTELPPVVSWGATMVRALTAVPDTLDWDPGLVTDRLSTFQVREIDPAPPVALVPPPPPPLPL